MCEASDWECVHVLRIRWSEYAISVLTPEKTVVAEEQDILQLHFVNYTKQCQFVYLYYLEETG